MVKINNYTLEQIQKNLILFYKKLVDKNLHTNFWIIADRSDFKPIKKLVKANKNEKKGNKKKEIKKNIHSIKEIRENILDKKGEYYKNKKFAEIKIEMNEDILLKMNDIRQYKDIKNKILFSVYIKIYLINNEGKLNLEDNWELLVNYYIDDLRTINFKQKNIEVLMRLASDSVITTDTIDGISYKKLLLKIEKNKK